MHIAYHHQDMLQRDIIWRKIAETMERGNSQVVEGCHLAEDSRRHRCEHCELRRLHGDDDDNEININYSETNEDNRLLEIIPCFYTQQTLI